MASQAFHFYVNHGLDHCVGIIEEKEERCGGGKLVGGVQARGARDVKWSVYVLRAPAPDNDVCVVLPAVENCDRFGLGDVPLD